MSDIFLSYNREDQTRARLFAEAFAAAGLTVWWDVTLRSGEAYDEVTEAALRGAKAVVVLWSPRSAVSRWVRAEATIADRCRTLLPAMIEPCERPIMFELTQTADLIHWHGASADPVWQGFLADVRRLIAAKDPAANTATVPLRAAELSPVLVATAQTPVAEYRAGRRPTLGILPFTNRSSEATDDAFGDAMAEDITAALSHDRGLRVLAHGTMSSFAGQVIDVRRIGADLAIDYIMEGNVRRLGETLRVTAQLVDSHSGAILWTQKFDRPSSQQAELLDELVADVSAHLGVKIQNIEMDRALKKSEPATPWEAIKRSWASIPKFTEEGLQRAITNARQALALAPDYALAESGLALALGVLYQRNGSRQPELLAEALLHCKSAMQRDEHPTVLFHVALVKSYALEWEESLILAQRSVDLNPYMPDALRTLAGALTRFERYEEALDLLDKADRMAPRGFTLAISLINRCWVLFGMGRIDEAIAVASQVLTINPGDRTAFMLRSSFYIEQGEIELACRDIAELRRGSPGEPLEMFMGTILASRQADGPRARNAELFKQAWDATPLAADAESAVKDLAG
jgi:TolB-like protein/Flp pilus assembly protein TadD